MISSIKELDHPTLKTVSLLFRALNHKLRQSMLSLIEERKKITVTEIYVALRIEQSVASQHLAILRKAGIVNAERDGKFIYYTVNYAKLSNIDQCAKDLTKEK